MYRTCAFTLIELLVVVTIIVVLLALLTPAMDRAVEAALRAKCAAQLHVQGAAFAQYAFDMKKKYPPPLSPLVWPDGSLMSSKNTIDDHTYVGPWQAAGQGVLYEQHYLTTPRLLYCPSSQGLWVRYPDSWGGDLGPTDPNYTLRWYNTYIHYPCFAGGYRSVCDTPDGELAAVSADNFLSPAPNIIATDCITIDFNRSPNDNTRNHRGDGSGAADTMGNRYDNAPVGGNVLSNDGASAWRNFSETQVRLRHSSDQRWFWF